MPKRGLSNRRKLPRHCCQRETVCDQLLRQRQNVFQDGITGAVRQGIKMGPVEKSGNPSSCQMANPYPSYVSRVEVGRGAGKSGKLYAGERIG